jgi:hypothetical protein
MAAQKRQYSKAANLQSQLSALSNDAQSPKRHHVAAAQVSKKSKKPVAHKQNFDRSVSVSQSSLARFTPAEADEE